MVVSTCILHAVKKASRKYLRPIFIDSLRVTVQGGSGGAGIPKYGGKGGNGGDVYIVCDETVKSLSVCKTKFKKQRFCGEAGGNSRLKGIIGTPGNDVTFRVPVGIRVETAEGSKLGELNKDGEKLLVAKGGLGGCNITQYLGTKGEHRTLILQLNLLADVALVGYPNAGKSTLLSLISKAKPKIASYPFTTVKPQLGVIQYDDGREITVADLPGLMEGAHHKVGMGFKFLKHVERTKLLLFILDIQGFRYSVRDHWRSCLENLISLNKELELYKPDIIDMPAVLLVNKMDTDNANQIYEEIRPFLSNLEDALEECNEDIRPEKVLQFEEILTTSLLSKNPEEITRIKNVVRTVLDDVEKRKLNLAERSEESKKRLEDSLEKFYRKHTPTLI